MCCCVFVGINHKHVAELLMCVCPSAVSAGGNEGEEVWHFCQNHSKVLEKIHRQEEVWTDERRGWVTKTKILCAVSAKSHYLSWCCKSLSLLVTQPQTSCTTPKSGGRTASTGTSLETTSGWSRGLSCGSSSPRGSASTSLTQLTSLTAGSRFEALGIVVVLSF